MFVATAEVDHLRRWAAELDVAESLEHALAVADQGWVDPLTTARVALAARGWSLPPAGSHLG